MENKDEKHYCEEETCEEDKTWRDFCEFIALYVPGNRETKRKFLVAMLKRRDKSSEEVAVLDRLLRNSAKQIQTYGTALDARNFNMLVMHYVGGLSHATIASKFHISSRAVYRGMNQCIDEYILIQMYGIDGVCLC